MNKEMKNDKNDVWNHINNTYLYIIHINQNSCNYSPIEIDKK